MAVSLKTPFVHAENHRACRHAHFEEVNDHHPLKISSTLGKGLVCRAASLTSPKSGVSHRGHVHKTGLSGNTRNVLADQNQGGCAKIRRPMSETLNRVESQLHRVLGVSRLGLAELTRKGRIGSSIRPLSAPLREGKRRKKGSSKSVKGRCGTRSDEPNEQKDEEDMFSVVQLAKEAKQFEEDTAFFRELEKSLQEPKHDDEGDTPVFNKRLFASQGNVIITEEARRLMFKNAKENAIGNIDTPLRKNEIHCLRCVVDGLKLIHKGQNFVKDVLSTVVTYEVYDAFKSVPHKSWEESLSCYFILNGAVEVTYDMRARESRNVYQANIIYSHGTGEYVGLVSPEGPSEDLAPPATIYTKELTQFIRIDRTRFHKIMKTAKEVIDKRKLEYISNHSFLANVPMDVREKILHKLSIQEYPANKVLLAQGETTEYLFIIMKGRCQTYREVYIPEAGKDVLFYLTSRDQDDFFGEECLLDQSPSYCTVVTATAITCLTLHKSALQIVNKERLTQYIDAERHEFVSPDELVDMGYKDSVWNKYKHEEIKHSLKEAGKMKYLNKPHCEPVLERPPGDEERYIENMRRFVMKGSSFEPVRAQSATVRKHRQKIPTRPHTAFAKRESKTTISDTKEKDVGVGAKDTDEQKTSALLTAAKAKELEKQVAKALDSKEAMMKLLESGEIGSNALNLDELRDKETFMKTGVLVTMTSADIVRKAKALADTYADKWKDRTDEDTEEWNTILHAENKQAKFLITANRMRIRDLKKKLLAIQKKREKLGLKKYDPENEATSEGESSKQTL